jgi:hypothetical protein
VKSSIAKEAQKSIVTYGHKLNMILQETSVNFNGDYGISDFNPLNVYLLLCPLCLSIGIINQIRNDVPYMIYKI